MDDFDLNTEMSVITDIEDDTPEYVDTTNLSVQEALRQIIDKHLEDNSNVNLGSLANEDISKSTINSFKKEYPHKNLTPNCIVGLMRSIHNNLSLTEISKIYNGKMGDFLKESALHYNDHSNYKHASRVLAKRLKSSDTHIIYILASSKGGVPIEVLKKEYGAAFIRRVERYVKKGELIKKNGRIYFNDKIGDTSLDIKTTFELGKNLVNRNFKLDNHGDDEKNNILHLRIEKVNPNHPAIKVELPELNKEYIKKYVKLCKKAKGDQDLWLFLCGDWLLDFFLKKPKDDDKGEP